MAPDWLLWARRSPPSEGATTIVNPSSDVERDVERLGADAERLDADLAGGMSSVERVHVTIDASRNPNASQDKLAAQGKGNAVPVEDEETEEQAIVSVDRVPAKSQRVRFPADE